MPHAAQQVTAETHNHTHHQGTDHSAPDVANPAHDRDDETRKRKVPAGRYGQIVKGSPKNGSYAGQATTYPVGNTEDPFGVNAE